jgi:lysophospholipase L1-like esterase
MTRVRGIHDPTRSATHTADPSLNRAPAQRDAVLFSSESKPLSHAAVPNSMRWRALVFVFVLTAAAAATRFVRTAGPHPASYALDDGVFRTVVLGDSVARGAGDEKGLGLPGRLDLERRSAGSAVTQNLGINGARTWNVRRLLRLKDAADSIRRADLIVMSIGGNDLYGDSRSRLLSRVWPACQRAITLERVDRIVEEIQRLNPDARIYLLGLYNPYRTTRLGPWLDAQVNLWDGGLIRRLARNRRVTVIRIADLMLRGDRISGVDHFHPGAQGYAAIARRIEESL